MSFKGYSLGHIRLLSSKEMQAKIKELQEVIHEFSFKSRQIEVGPPSLSDPLQDIDVCMPQKRNGDAWRKENKRPKASQAKTRRQNRRKGK